MLTCLLVELVLKIAFPTFRQCLDFDRSAQRFYMDGYVRTPGTYVLDPGLTIQQAIALAGGLTERGSDRGITATRLIKAKTVEVPLKMDDKVQPNDTIHIRSRFF